MAKTNFAGKIQVLGHFYLHYDDDEDLKDFVEHHDLGLPFAYGLQAGMITLNPSGKVFVEQAFDGLLEALGIEDTGFKSWDDVEDILSN
jgi:hypothetical protein